MGIELFGFSVLASVIAGVIVKLIFFRKSAESKELATRVLTMLEGDIEEKTRRLVYLTKVLGDSLKVLYAGKTAIPADQHNEPLRLIDESLAILKPYVSELTATDKKLDHLKRAVNEFQKGLEWRKRIIEHLTNPPNPSAMHPGHVDSQLLDENHKPHDLLNAAKGEAVLFLRGTIRCHKRWSYYRQFRREERAKYLQALKNRYRTMLQQTALFKAKK